MNKLKLKKPSGEFTAAVRRGLMTVQAVVLVTASLLPLGVSAASLGTRSLSLESSAPSANTGHNFSFVMGTSGATVGAFKFEYCSNDPFPGTACTAPTGLNVDAVTIQTQSGVTGFTLNATGTTANSIVVEKATPQALTGTPTITFDFNGAVNPSAANTEFFVRVYAYSNTAATTLVDDAGLAFSTGQNIQVTARVQETLSFCVYTGANCAAGGSLVNLGVLNTSTIRNANSFFDVATNARNGVVVQYLGDTLESGAFSIDAFGGTTPGDGTPEASAVGQEQFGLRVDAVTTGGQNAVAAAPFSTMTATQYAYLVNAYDNIASSTGPVALTTFTIKYGANVAALTETGVYNTSINYIATATF